MFTLRMYENNKYRAVITKKLGRPNIKTNNTLCYKKYLYC